MRWWPAPPCGRRARSVRLFQDLWMQPQHRLAARLEISPVAPVGHGVVRAEGREYIPTLEACGDCHDVARTDDILGFPYDFHFLATAPANHLTVISSTVPFFSTGRRFLDLCRAFHIGTRGVRCTLEPAPHQPYGHRQAFGSGGRAGALGFLPGLFVVTGEIRRASTLAHPRHCFSGRAGTGLLRA